MNIPPLNDYLIENSRFGKVYDVEVYPNYFCVTFYDGNSFEQFEIGFSKNEIDKILDFVEGKVLIGYNSNSFDDLVINYLALCRDNLRRLPIEKVNELIFNVSQRIIKYQNRKDLSQKDDLVIELIYYKRFYYTLDLMKAGAFHKSLKLLAIALKHDWIQDLPIEFDSFIEETDIPLILSYNKNDCVITYKLLSKLKEKIELRHDMSDEYDLYLMNDPDSHMANRLLKKFYEEELGSGIDFKDLRTSRDDIKLSDCIMPKVAFKTKQLQSFLDKFKEIVLRKSDDYDYKFPFIEFYGKKYQPGVGGLHSEDGAAVFKSSESCKLIDADVASYYPSIMINENIIPAHLGDEFLRILKNLKDSRLQLKKEGNKTKSDGMKIVINSIFGKLGFGGNFLYDKQAFYKVTLNGQLYLLMLIEDLELNGISVISANTDGVVSKVPVDKVELYYKICKEWQEKLNLELEFIEYKTYVRRDVNNYFSIDVNDKVKSKGAFLQNIDLNKGFHAPVTRFALYKYFAEGKDYIEFLKEHKDIYDFCMSQKVGSQFKGVYWGDEKVQKSVRFYASNSGRKLFKVKEDDSQHDLCAKHLVTLLNKYDETIKADIDYSYYIDDVKKVIREIETIESYQEALF